MTYEEICNILVKKKLSGQEKLDLVKDEILKNAEMINTLSPLKKFEYTNIVGLSILYAPEVFNFIQKNDLHINYSLITKNKESLLHLATRSKYQYEFIDKILEKHPLGQNASLEGKYNNRTVEELSLKLESPEIHVMVVFSNIDVMLNVREDIIDYNMFIDFLCDV